jgi:hypothetical protein
MKTYYLTKYALTKGILEVQSNEPPTKNDDIHYQHKNWHEFSCYAKFDEEIFNTKEEAIAKAEEMRCKKIESLKKQIQKLEKKSFVKNKLTEKNENILFDQICIN